MVGERICHSNGNKIVLASLFLFFFLYVWFCFCTWYRRAFLVIQVFNNTNRFIRTGPQNKTLSLQNKALTGYGKLLACAYTLINLSDISLSDKILVGQSCLCYKSCVRQTSCPFWSLVFIPKNQRLTGNSLKSSLSQDCSRVFSKKYDCFILI